MNDIRTEIPSPWHSGERALQAKVGVAERMETLGKRVIRDYMPDQHREFYEHLPYLILGAVDNEGWPWATLLDAQSGFIHSPDARRLDITRRLDADDPSGAEFAPGAALGMLGIDLHTRRRNRINGHISDVWENGFSVSVEYSFGNCPQYIQLRALKQLPLPTLPQRPAAQRLTALDDAAIATIRGADTFFVASYVDLEGAQPHRSVDVSHRGGQAGFVRVDGDVLTIPDFAGNLFFNTLGNFQVNPKAGLLFVDFQTGELLQVAGTVTLILEGPEIAAFQGAERLWQVRVEQVVRRPAALRSRWEFQGWSPNSLMTGDWQQTAARLQADALRDQWRPMRVTRIEDESDGIRSFYFEPADGAGLPAFKAGQHLPLRLALSPSQQGRTPPLIRTYSLSSAPSDGFFRISVKRDGLASAYLHDQVKVGDLLQARAPQGSFVLHPQERRPLVLLGAGIGVTPMLSMLREVIYEGKRVRGGRATWFIQSARRLADLAFREEVDTLIARAGDQLTAIRVLSQPETSARVGEDFHLTGRIDLDLLKALLPFDDFDFYVCGPAAFTQEIYDGLRALHIRDERIHAETFGPSSLKRSGDSRAIAFEQPPAATEAVPVVFERSAKEARWQPAGGSLLELAESGGLSPEFSCRGGSCGTCKTRLISGQVHYPVPPAEMPAPDHVLICCAVPASGPLVLDL
ncbi:pyridoxamine 5'-phosphate oxidase family protein [Pseudomonas petrae]|uniref:Pyridoxamine 5'-phosphate oxidase family protein n=1 Tax=Pseudomonas petrae TaxID=2912190 RepID=A0ABS9IB31_9PSED|nr:pyridoxamine 5'-phosphate oxidase family protein [Pseudomonas petrae]MCF7535020.1 pyridoxamine 5'-phosphate oxidase family protein [Pseudomonas petrae]MCF7538143.1 pyridoxamine 5'-phosphate oxidase family protein [Pseudomonas petrae]MCF7544935.1 pyridoxamine 5'-phosphate oxidase family protein [Pseudomonas petrae]